MKDLGSLHHFLGAKVSSDMAAPVSDPTAYHNLVGALQHPSFTRPNVSYTIQQVCFICMTHVSPSSLL
jgi:hypothetical protein